MTSYGFGESRRDGQTYSCEIRTLNSRFLEVSVRLPRHLIALETEIQNRVKARLNRGKVDIFCDVLKDDLTRELPQLDEAAVKHYAQLFDQLTAVLQKSLSSSFASLQDPSAADFFRMEGVLLTPDRARERGPEAAETHRDGVFAALDLALDAALKARATEGDALRGALVDLLASLEEDRRVVADKRDAILGALQENYRRRIENALAALRKVEGSGTIEISEDRILAEVAILSDKSDIEEELTRLKTHITEFGRLLDEGGPVGRKLDFLCQEMHREVNTISNKLTQTEVAHHTLNMKQTVERVRQQVQNIE